MLINYKPRVEHVKMIPLVSDPKDPKSYNRTCVQLLPGTNEVTDDEWKCIQPHIAKEIKIGEIVVMKVDNRKDKSKKARSLKEVPANIAQDIIRRCNNPATLKKWFNEEGRDEIILAITKRMRKLKIDPEEIEKELDKESDKLSDLETDTESGDDTETASDDDDEEESGDGDDDENDTDDDDEEIPAFDETE